MNATLESTTLEMVVSQATPEQRRYLIEKLLAKDAKESRFLPILVQNDAGDYIGYYMPRFHPKSNRVPKFSEAQELEFKRRIDSLDKTFTHEQLLAELGLPVVHLQKI